MTQFNLPANFQGNIHSWSDENGGIYKSGDVVRDLTLTYTLGELVTGISTTNENIFSFYPNPSTDYIHTELEISDLIIRDVHGLVVNQFRSSEFTYDISDLESGVYIINARGTDGTTYTSKMIKK